MAQMMSRFYEKLIFFMENSWFFKIINGILNFFARLCSGSIFVSIISGETDQYALENSFIYKIINGFFSIFKKLGQIAFIEAFEGSFIVGMIRGIPSFLFSLRLSHVGAGTMAIFVSYSLSTGFSSIGLVSIIIFALTVAMLFVNKDFYCLIQNSFICKYIFEVFGLKLPQKNYKPNYGISYLFCVALGILVGVSFAFLPAIMVIVSIVGLCGALTVVCYPFIGVLAIVFFAPFLPTMILAAMIIGVTFCFLLKLIIDKKTIFRLDIIGIWIVFFIFVGLFKGVTSLAPSSSIKIAMLTSLFLWFYFLFVSLVDTKKKFDSTVIFFAFAAFFVGLIGLYQKISGQIDLTWVDKEAFEDLSRIYSTFGNPNVYGEYLLLAIPICLAGAYFYKYFLVKMFFLGTSALLILNLALTYSRGCYLAIGFGLIVFIFLMEKRFIAFFLIGLLFLPFVLPPAMLERILSITNFEDSSTSYRIMIWQATTRMLGAYWLPGIGQGIEAYNVVYPLYGFNEVSAPHAHNLFLQIFIETGIVGLMVFFGILLSFFKTLVPFFCRTRDVSKKIFLAILMSMMAAFMLQSLFDYSFYNYSVYLIFFMSIGIASCFVKVYGSKVEVISCD